MGAAARAPSRRGSRSTAPRHLTAASRGPSWPPCSGAHLCARGNSSSSRIVCLPVLRVALRAFSVLRPKGLAAKPHCPGLRLTRNPAAPRAPPPGLFAGSLAGARGAFGAPTTGGPVTTQHGHTVQCAPGATGSHARVQRPQARQRGTGNAALRPTMRGPPCRHCRASGRSSTGKAPCEGGPSPAAPGTVEPLKPGVPTVPQSPTWPDSPRGPEGIVRFMAQW